MRIGFFSLLFIGMSNILSGQAIEWAEGFGDNNSDNSNAVYTDGSGFIYVTGDFQGSCSLGTFQLTSNGSKDIFVAKYDSSGICVWAKQVGGTGDDVGSAITADASGNIYVTGTFSSTVSFGSTTLTAGVGYPDIFVAKLDGNGNFIWTNKNGGAYNELSNGICLDGNGNVYIAGSFGDMNTGASTTFGTTTFYCWGDEDVFVEKYSNSGAFIWAKQAGGTLAENVRGITADNVGNVYMTGYFKGTSAYGSVTLTSASNFAVMVLKYSTSGTCVWAKQSVGAFSWGEEIALDGNGNLYVVGRYTGSNNYGTHNLNATGVNAFLTKYDSAGNCIWASGAGGSGWTSHYSVDVDGSLLYVTGTFTDTATFGAGSIVSNGTYDVFVAGYDTAGVCNWVVPFGGIDNDCGLGVSSDGQDNIYIAGFFRDSVAAGQTWIVANGSNDGFLIKINSTATGVFENLGTERITAYPNPTTGIFTLKTDTSFNPVNGYLMNSVGEMVMEFELNSNESIDIAFAPPGIYFIVLQYPTFSSTQKIIKLK